MTCPGPDFLIFEPLSVRPTGKGLLPLTFVGLVSHTVIGTCLLLLHVTACVFVADSIILVKLFTSLQVMFTVMCNCYNTLAYIIFKLVTKFISNTKKCYPCLNNFSFYVRYFD